MQKKMIIQIKLGNKLRKGKYFKERNEEVLELKLMAEGGLKLINDEYIILACLLLCNRCRRINAALEKYKLQTNIVTKKCIVSIWAQLI